MHGRNRFRLTPAERTGLGEYLERGGTLMADAICASDAFADAFRNEMREVLQAYPLEPIPADDPLLTPEYGGFDIRQVSRRDPQAAAAGDPLAARNRQVPPELEGIRIDGRWAVIFSRYDLSCASSSTIPCNAAGTAERRRPDRPQHPAVRHEPVTNHVARQPPRSVATDQYIRLGRDFKSSVRSRTECHRSRLSCCPLIGR